MGSDLVGVAAGLVFGLVVAGLEGDADVLEVVLANDTRCRIPDPSGGRDEEADEDGDDADHHQQFDQCEGTAPTGLMKGEHEPTSQ
jgi:hypothetical protein